MPNLRYPSNVTKSYLIKLSLPIFISNLAIPLVGIIDTGLMGHLENANFLIATSLASSGWVADFQKWDDLGQYGESMNINQNQ